MITLSSQAFNTRTLLIAALLAASVFFFSILPQAGFVFPHLVNSGHAFVFGIGTYLMMHLFASSYRLTHIVLVAVLALSIGIIIELLQPLVGRQRSIVDVVYDFMGCSAAALWFYASVSSHRRLVRLILRSLALAFVLGSLLYPGYRLFVLQQVDRLAPVLADFEDFWWMNTMWANNHARLERSSAPAEWSNESNVGRIIFPQHARYPGLSFAYLNKDWRDYSSLEFELFSAEQEVSVVTVRVHDHLHNNEYHDRFNRALMVQPGLNSYRINLNNIKVSPKKRDMDMSHITGLMLFMSRPTKDTVFYIDHVRLTK